VHSRDVSLVFPEVLIINLLTQPSPQPKVMHGGLETNAVGE
jgi:hypothetical protein